MDPNVKVEQEINPLELLHVIVKRKMVIIAITVLAAVVSVVYSLMLPNIYFASAKVLPPQKETGGLSALLTQAGGVAGLAAGGLGGNSDLYVGILKSRSIADAVVERLDLLNLYEKKTLEEARSVVEAAVQVQAGKDGIISIVASDKDPKRAALLANTFVDELSKTTVRLNLSPVGAERVFLEKRLELVKKDLRAAEDELNLYAQRNKIVHVDAQAQISIESLARLKAELISKQVELSVLQNNQTEQSPEVKAVQNAIKRLKTEISVLSGRKGTVDGIPSLGSVPGVGLEYARKMREFKTQEALFEQLTKQYELAKFSEAKDSSSLQVLDVAVPPAKKGKPARALIVIVSTATAFIVSIFLVFFLEYMARMSEREREIVEDIKRAALSFK